MAKKKATMEEIVEQAKEDLKETPYKAWGERNNEERRESYNEYAKSIIAKSIKDKKTFWFKDADSKTIDNSIPYNASKGTTYGGLTSILLRAVTEMEGYKEPSFLTMQQANFMGGRLKKQLDDEGKPILTKNGKESYVRGVKVAILKEYDYKPKLDEKGEAIEKEVLRKDGTTTKEPVMEKYFLEKPVLETITLYHTSQFEGLKQEKLKERDLKPLQKYRENLKNDTRDYRPNLERLGLSSRITTDLENFLTSQAKGIDYVKIKTQEVSKTQDKKQEMSMGR